MRSMADSDEISPVSPTSQLLLKWVISDLSQGNLCCRSHDETSIAPKYRLGDSHFLRQDINDR